MREVNVSIFSTVDLTPGIVNIIDLSGRCVLSLSPNNAIDLANRVIKAAKLAQTPED